MADVDYSGTRIDLDATLQQSPTESITAKGTVPTVAVPGEPDGGHVEPAAGRRDRSADQVDGARTSGSSRDSPTLVTNVTGTLEATST